MEDALEDLRLRLLTAAEYADIVAEEGLKPAFAVGEDFNLYAGRVRAIWNGHEPKPEK
jgi:hypothetical protein